MRKKRNKITQAKNKSTKAQVTQLTKAVLAQENATIESILFFTQRKHLRCVHLNGNRASDCRNRWVLSLQRNTDSQGDCSRSLDQQQQMTGPRQCLGLADGRLAITILTTAHSYCVCLCITNTLTYLHVLTIPYPPLGVI